MVTWTSSILSTDWCTKPPTRQPIVHNTPPTTADIPPDGNQRPTIAGYNCTHATPQY